MKYTEKEIKSLLALAKNGCPPLCITCIWAETNEGRASRMAPRILVRSNCKCGRNPKALLKKIIFGE